MPCESRKPPTPPTPQRGAPRTVVERSKGLVCEDLHEDQWSGDQDAHIEGDLGAAALWFLQRSVHLIT